MSLFQQVWRSLERKATFLGVSTTWYTSFIYLMTHCLSYSRCISSYSFIPWQYCIYIVLYHDDVWHQIHIYQSISLSLFDMNQEKMCVVEGGWDGADAEYANFWRLGGSTRLESGILIYRQNGCILDCQHIFFFSSFLHHLLLAFLFRINHQQITSSVILCTQFVIRHQDI